MFRKALILVAWKYMLNNDVSTTLSAQIYFWMKWMIFEDYFSILTLAKI
jgi:hypothetical protein